MSGALEKLKNGSFIEEVTAELAEVDRLHPVAVSPSLLSLINPHDPGDPVARQFLPDVRELEDDPLALPDPIGDLSHSPVKGIVHRYHDRLLLNLTDVCPAYCRFCFRRGRVGSQAGMLNDEEILHALAYIQKHKEIWEVILSGGEPLNLPPRRLSEVLAELDSIPHVKTLRIHTRLPITMPEKVCQELLEPLGKVQKPINILIHCNHPRELSGPVRAALLKLSRAGLSLFSQSVLLKGVNDSVETLEALMREFILCHIKPHYIHHLDLAQGTKHFRVPLEEGIKLIRELHARVPSLCRPHYMIEIPGGAGKISLLSSSVQRTEKGWVISTGEGKHFSYPE